MASARLSNEARIKILSQVYVVSKTLNVYISVPFETSPLLAIYANILLFQPHNDVKCS